MTCDCVASSSLLIWYALGSSFHTEGGAPKLAWVFCGEERKGVVCTPLSFLDNVAIKEYKSIQEQ